MLIILFLVWIGFLKESKTTNPLNSGFFFIQKHLLYLSRPINEKKRICLSSFYREFEGFGYVQTPDFRFSMIGQTAKQTPVKKWRYFF